MSGCMGVTRGMVDGAGRRGGTGGSGGIGPRHPRWLTNSDISGKLGKSMVQHALDRGYGIVGCAGSGAPEDSARSRGASPSYPEQRTTARSSRKRLRGATGFSPGKFPQSALSLARPALG